MKIQKVQNTGVEKPKLEHRRSRSALEYKRAAGSAKETKRTAASVVREYEKHYRDVSRSIRTYRQITDARDLQLSTHFGKKGLSGWNHRCSKIGPDQWGQLTASLLTQVPNRRILQGHCTFMCGIFSALKNRNEYR